MFFIRFVRTLFVAASILVLSTTGSYSQEEEPPAPAEAPGAVWRIGFWEILHQTFSSDEDHPFYQMTGTSRFKGGQGFFGFTVLDPGTNGIIFMALPPVFRRCTPLPSGRRVPCRVLK